MRDCLSEEEVLDFCSGKLSDHALNRVHEHLEICSACLEMIQVFNRTGSEIVFDRKGEQPIRNPPEKIGSYVLGDELGAGGMGLVYEAYDAQLDRRIAMKLMHHQGRNA